MDPTLTAITRTRRDRIAGLGAEYRAAVLDAEHRRMVVVDEEVDDEPVWDMTELMSSLCARLHGRRSAAHRAARAVEVATTGGGRDG